MNWEGLLEAALLCFLTMETKAILWCYVQKILEMEQRDLQEEKGKAEKVLGTLFFTSFLSLSRFFLNHGC